MVGDHAVGDVGLVLEVRGIGLRAARGADRLEDRREDVGVVVAALALETETSRSKPMPVSTCLAGSGVERAVGLAVELDEDEVPDLDDVGIAAVDEACRRRGPPCGRCGSRVHGPHGPVSPISQKLSFFVARQRCAPRDRCLRQRSRASSSGVEPRLRVAARSRSRRAASGSRPQTFGQQLPRPVDRLGLEVVAEGPVAEHLEEGVVVGVAGRRPRGRCACRRRGCTSACPPPRREGARAVARGRRP